MIRCPMLNTVQIRIAAGFFGAAFVSVVGQTAVFSAEEQSPATNTVAASAISVSYYHDVRPILQAHCQGCHQPAKISGGLDLTSFANMLKGGESDEPGIVPGKPDKSHLVEVVTASAGKAEMPKDSEPLDNADVALIRNWIEQGAQDDTPPSTQAAVDMAHPPIYSGPPVITSLDWSPDGKLLAVAGFHEVLLNHADGSGLVARLIGMSERIESIRFSPDGKRLAIAGGRPAQMGEVQIWDVIEQKLLLSHPLTHDSVYGVSWSPDGKLVACGCTDKTVRAIDVESGKEVLYQRAHDDWVLGTVFSADGRHVVSVGRDMSAKLIEVATQRLIDDVTSITPGALKGGIQSVKRHPLRDEIVFGGADGIPKIYRMFRTTARVIGDDANELWELPALPGRIFSVDISRDGRLIASGSSLDGHGYIHVDRMDPAEKTPDEIQKILQKPTHERSDAEKSQLQQHFADGVATQAKVEISEGAVYAVALSPDGERVAAAGGDGIVRLIATKEGTILRSFSPVEIAPKATDAVASSPISTAPLPQHPSKPLDPEPAMPSNDAVTKLSIEPAEIVLRRSSDYLQLVVTADLASGAKIDVTRLASITASQPVLSVNPTGMVAPHEDGDGVLTATFGSQTVSVDAHVSGAATSIHPDFVQDVAPIIARIGCNAGSCHGARAGKNGFKLSLRGYDPVFDVRALTDDLASRRVSVSSPEVSLMLLKPTAAVPHQGGQVLQPGSAYYQILRQWIADGGKLNTATSRATHIEVAPINPVIQSVGARQQFRVVANYADGTQRDVTREAFLDSGNTDVSKTIADRPALLEALRRGEAPVLVRYEGNYAATTLTVMGDRTGFVWEAPPTYNHIDELVAAKLQRTKTLSSSECADYEFVRRVYLDLTGLAPTPAQVQAFVDDPRESREKRDVLVDKLIGSEEFVEYWTNKWSDLLMVNRKFLGLEGAVGMRHWIREQVADNTPYNRFVKTILTAAGSTKDNPAASYFKTLRTPQALAENTTQLFLATRFNCNKCHDHPFERWTQDQYYQLSAYFAQVGVTKDSRSGDTVIGASDVDAGQPLYEIVADKSDGEVRNERTGAVAAPSFPFQCKHEESENASRREQLATWITSDDNPYFAKSYVNRIWGYLTGKGIIEPLDDIRAGNPPTNPELLEYLTDEFIHSGFDARRVMSLICKSRTYQLSVATNRWNEDDTINYSHAIARRLPAEVLYDAIYRAAGAASAFPNVPSGTRAAALPDVGVELPDGFLASLGRPPRESACECERVNQLQLGPIMALVSGPTVNAAITYPGNTIAKLAADVAADDELVNKLFLQFVCRPAQAGEIIAAKDLFQAPELDNKKLVAELEDYTKKIEPVLATHELERQQRIAEVQTKLEEYRQALQPQRAKREEERQKRVEAAEAALTKYDAELSARLPDWEANQHSATKWYELNPTQSDAPAGARLTRQSDHSIFVDGANPHGAYRVVAPIPIDRVTGIRLEALSDSRLPHHGPGRSSDGNFFLTEFTGRWMPTPVEPRKLVREWTFTDKIEPWQAQGPTNLAVDNGRLQVFGWDEEGGVKTALEEPPGTYLLEIDTGMRPSVAIKIEWMTTSHSTPDPNQSLARSLIATDRDDAPATFEISTDEKLTELRVIVQDHPGMLPIKVVRLYSVPKPAFADIKLINPQATFNQENHDVAQAIDGNSKADNSGWGIADRTGEDQAAIFQLTDPLQAAKDRIIELALYQNYSNGTAGDQTIGRFRIAVTDAAEPLNFGLPQGVVTALAKQPDQRSDDDHKTLLKYVRSHDDEYRKLYGQLEDAKKPLPDDVELVKLEADLAQANKPLPLDQQLQQLRRSVALSEEQLSQKRLTVAQDIAWALINSPEFLYNH
jgi:WD40 repeat protein/mono/diheme cytochrome c family protein